MREFKCYLKEIIHLQLHFGEPSHYLHNKNLLSSVEKKPQLIASSYISLLKRTLCTSPSISYRYQHRINSTILFASSPFYFAILSPIFSYIPQNFQDHNTTTYLCIHPFAHLLEILEIPSPNMLLVLFPSLCMLSMRKLNRVLIVPTFISYRHPLFMCVKSFPINSFSSSQSLHTWI